ncbi:hypothetical protein IM725_03780 [Ramlibacter aquaticus]|uniref:DUF4402 domain-containing protein n=1 Tax=Ramlibacter aquaticus TaxID=2780094 RepID=A0ABR9SD77_9BURK|nr:hypothetical protein [Ramlibacter aquaticus]MBE7939692.1 hypothetical protein [Ramlibacter aquaticus]
MKSDTNRFSEASAYALAAVVLGALHAPLPALADSLTVPVSATILPHASVQVLAQPSTVVLTAKDIERGYVELPSRLRLAVKNNTPGYMLVFAGEGDFVRQVRVSGLGSDVQMGAGGGGVTLRTPGRGMNQSLLDIGFRLELAQGVQQGVYPWPFQVSVVPL